MLGPSRRGKMPTEPITLKSNLVLPWSWKTHLFVLAQAKTWNSKQWRNSLICRRVVRCSVYLIFNPILSVIGMERPRHTASHLPIFEKGDLRISGGQEYALLLQALPYGFSRRTLLWGYKSRFPTCILWGESTPPLCCQYDVLAPPMNRNTYTNRSWETMVLCKQCA